MRQLQKHKIIFTNSGHVDNISKGKSSHFEVFFFPGKGFFPIHHAEHACAVFIASGFAASRLTTHH
jgi:hypothetical protein